MATKPERPQGKQTRRTRKSSPPERRSGQEQSLSLERIVAAAIELLDAEGVDGLTMRKLADRLGAGAMSLYWHVSNKEAVFDLALDAVLQYRVPPEPAAPQDWRSAILHMLEDWRASMLRHPWSAALLPSRTLGPNMLDRLELLSRTLSGAGVAPAELNPAIWSLWNYVMGATVTRSSFDLGDRTAAPPGPVLPAGQYPAIENTRLLLDDDWDGTFRKGLGFLLDGLPLR